MNCCERPTDILGYDLPSYSTLSGSFQESVRASAALTKNYFIAHDHAMNFEPCRAFCDHFLLTCQAMDLDSFPKARAVAFNPAINFLKTFELLMKEFDFISFFKKQKPQYYEMAQGVSKLIQASKLVSKGDFSTHVFFATRYIEINGDKFELASYGTGCKQLETPEASRLEFKANAQFSILHQPPLEAKEMMKKIADLFDAAIRWKKKEGLDALMCKVALVHYLVQHASPWHRGSGSLGEEIEQILYKHHGFEVLYHKDMSPPYVALTSSFQEFLGKYGEMVHVREIKSPEASAKS